MSRILVITTEPLPFDGGLTTGAGLRAWGLAQGLKSQGFDVVIATPLEGEQAERQHARIGDMADAEVRFFHRSELGTVVDAVRPDVVVMQHWGLMYALPEVTCPLVIDLAGPHLLERRYWGNPDAERDLQEKLAALRRADFVVCSGEFQRHYFYPYLMQAGFDIRNCPVPVIPFSVPVTGPARKSAAGGEQERETTFVYGGAFLAWQNPEMPLRWLLEEMTAAETGRLLFYGGSHPSMDASGGRFLELYQTLKDHPLVEMRGWKPFDVLVQEYADEGDVALDLMERNPERELAYTTRTMVYLHCGLPVIYNDYSEVSGVIAEGGCGWTLPPDDEVQFRTLVRALLTNRDCLPALRERARAVAQEQNWEKTIAPLAEFCRSPVKRTRPAVAVAGDEGAENLPDRGESEAICQSGRKYFRQPGKYLGTVLAFPTWVIAHYLCFFLKNRSKNSRALK